MALVPSGNESGKQIETQEYSSTESTESEVTKKKGTANILEKTSSFQNEEASRTVEQTANSMTVSDSAAVESKVSKSVVMQSSSMTKKVSQTITSSASEFSETQGQRGIIPPDPGPQQKEVLDASGRVIEASDETTIKIFKVQGKEENQSEIKQEHIKNQLKEIISEIDQSVETEDQEFTGAGQTQNGNRRQEAAEMTSNGRLTQIQEEKSTHGSVTTELTQVETNGRSQETNGRGFLGPGLIQRRPSVSIDTETGYSYSKPSKYYNLQIDTDKKIAQELQPPVPIPDEKGQAIPEHKPIDLQKLFTPAVDAVEIEPQKNRIMYSSSSFYSPNLHPTVEDQVQLARRISQSLSDISNEQSKGQSMYVNRKKRSVKWIHSGGEGGLNNSVVPQTPDFNNHHQNNQFQDENKPILKLIMDPRGHVQDLTSLKNQGFVIEPAALSPDICKDIVRSLNATKGKGAELFAKRRKKSEKWVVGESNSTTLQESAISISNQNVPPITSPLGVPTKPAANIPPLSYLQGSTERVQNVQKMNEIQERFNQPRVKLIKSPWEVALETGSVDGAFQENAQSGLNNLPPWTPNPNNYCPEIPPAALPKPYAHNPAYNSNSVNRIVENIQRGNGVVPTPNSIYKPKIPTGWSGSAGVIQPPNDNYTVRPLPPPTPPPIEIPSPPPRMDLSALNNYNTAPRGWNKASKEYYRPITFDPVKAVPKNASFTDF